MGFWQLPIGLTRILIIATYLKESADPSQSSYYQHSTILHSAVVIEYLKTELNQNRVAGSFVPLAVTRDHTSRFGVISKHHYSNKWHLIVDLSYPKSFNVNNGIQTPLFIIVHYHR